MVDTATVYFLAICIEPTLPPISKVVFLIFLFLCVSLDILPWNSDKFVKFHGRNSYFVPIFWHLVPIFSYFLDVRVPIFLFFEGLLELDALILEYILLDLCIFGVFCMNIYFTIWGILGVSCGIIYYYYYYCTFIEHLTRVNLL